MTCDEFQQQLPELFESGMDQDKHPHLQTCDNCAALVRDLNYIAQQAKLLLPIQDPSPEGMGKDPNPHLIVDRKRQSLPL